MKNIFISLVVLMSSNLWASDFLDTDSKSLLCNDPEVVLSKSPVPCDVNIDPNRVFDVPGLEINFKDAEKLLLGTESSAGGRVVSPVAMPTRARVITPEFEFKLELSCKAKLVSDGGKTLSFYSEQEIILNEMKSIGYLDQKLWINYLIKGSSLSPAVKYPVPSDIEINLPTYKISLVNSGDSKMVISICSETKNNNQSCSEIEKKINTKKVSLRLINKNLKAEITRKVQLNCSINL